MFQLGASFNSAPGSTWRKIQIGRFNSAPEQLGTGPTRRRYNSMTRQPSRVHVAISFTFPPLQFFAAQLFYINSFLAPAMKKIVKLYKYFLIHKIGAFLT